MTDQYVSSYCVTDEKKYYQYMAVSVQDGSTGKSMNTYIKICISRLGSIIFENLRFTLDMILKAKSYQSLTLLQIFLYFFETFFKKLDKCRYIL